MFRARRYRVLLIFAAVLILTFLHITRSRDSVTVPDKAPESYSPGSAGSNARPGSKTEPKPQAPPPAEQNKSPPVVPDNSRSGSSVSDSIKSPAGQNAESKEDNTKVGAGKLPDKGPADGWKEVGGGGTPPPPALETGSTSGAQSLASLEDIDRGGSGRLPVPRPEPGTSVPRWKKFPEQYPIPTDEMIRLPNDKPNSIPKLQAKIKDESSADKQERLQQLSTIKAEFKHAWQGYKKIAMGHDEVKPLTSTFVDPFNGWGATLVDTLDTLWIMELKEEFSEAVDVVKKIDFKTSLRRDIPVFETVIRYLGGLIGAYDISGKRYPVLLEKAEELAEVLFGIFDTPNRMPVLYYKWHPEYVARRHRASAAANLAELGSLSMEFTRLAQLTKEDKYYDAIARITNELEDLQDESNFPGLWPMFVNAQGCDEYNGPPPKNGVLPPTRSKPKVKKDLPTPVRKHKAYAAPTDLKSYLGLISRDGIDLSKAEPAVYNHGSSSQTVEDRCEAGLKLPQSRRHNKYSMGGSADSTYEYLPKEYLLLGGVNDQYKNMYKKAMDATRKNLVFKPMVKDHRDIRFIASTKGLDRDKKGKLLPIDLSYDGTHLTCFAGGMFALGSKVFGIESDMDLAYKLTDGCVWAYESTKTGLMPESFRLFPCGRENSCEWDEALIEADKKLHSSVQASESEPQFRNGESIYGQRVKMAPSQATGGSVPMPMPGSMNPHDSGVLKKRGSFAAEGYAAASSSIASPAIPTPGSLENVANRDTVRTPQSPSAPLADHMDAKDPPPPGMVKIHQAEYILRPEAIESVFLMFRLTGDDYWRRKGWKMFEAIIKHSKTPLAHAGIKDVNEQKVTQRDSMESFWLAETLKYFYLLFSDPSVVDLDKYVLTTEAHPFLRPV